MKNCVIIEDEQPAIELLSSYLEKVPDWQLVQVCRNAIEAAEYLRSHSADILFVDIEMPMLSGIEFNQSLTDPPLCIITSAHVEYGVKAYDLNVFDYLLKPYSFARLLQTYNKLNEKEDRPAETLPSSVDTYIILKEKGQNKRVNIEDILFAESQRSYVVLTTVQGVIRSKMTLNSLESSLPSEMFIRVHRSFIVALKKVDSFNQNKVQIGEKSLPIGRLYKKDVRSRLDGVKD
ncbi:MAG: response regulator transcription factor [Flavobacteriales bacterium]|nr:response regulator transcription factor [Flavobacteriales bacterium]